MRFFVYNTFNKMKETDEDSVIFRRILKSSDDCRRFPKKSRSCFEHISYISQSPGSRVQSPESSPVQSPVQLLDYANLKGSEYHNNGHIV